MFVEFDSAWKARRPIGQKDQGDGGMGDSKCVNYNKDESMRERAKNSTVIEI